MGIFDKLLGNSGVGQNNLSNSNQLAGATSGNPGALAVSGTFTSSNASYTHNVALCDGITQCICGQHVPYGPIPPGTSYVTQIPNLHTSLFNPSLTPSEKEELDRLEADRLAYTKEQKLKVFKGLPSSIRQQMVDKIILRKTILAANLLDAPKSQRQQELEKRADPY